MPESAWQSAVSGFHFFLHSTVDNYFTPIMQFRPHPFGCGRRCSPRGDRLRIKSIFTPCPGLMQMAAGISGHPRRSASN